jgi:Leucine-rich repeat (LRR) protein
MRLRLFLMALTLSFVSFCLSRGASVSVPLARWGLPRDLIDRQEHLTDLTLPPAVDRLDWISSNIERLNISGTRIKSLNGLPLLLKQLDIRDAAEIRDLNGLPPGLEVLKVSGQNITSVKNLPSSLVDLYLQDTSIEDLSDLPSGLKAIVLSGASFHSLDGLPATLQSLTLHGTKVKSIKGIRDTLRKLILVSNPDLRFEADDLPPRLTYLVVDDQVAPSWGSVSYLCSLADRRDLPLGPWPNFLSSLTLRATNLVELPKLPPALHALGLLHCNLRRLGDLPSELESLDLTGFRRLEIPKLPTGLKKLKLNESSIHRLPKLPDGLEELDISNTEITSLADMPPGLRILIFRGSTRKRVEEIERLPALEKLDLTGSALEEIGTLPKTLSQLSLRGTKIRTFPAEQLANLVELDISGTQIRWQFLRHLPRGLKILTLSEGQMDRLDGLPDTVRAIHFIRLGALN